MSTPEPTLIERLEALAACFPTAAALAVQFPEYVDFVRRAEQDKLARLKGLIDAGGEPIGFVFAQRDGRHVEINAMALPETENEPGIEHDLQTIIEYFRALLVEDGKCAAPVAQ